MVVYDADEKRHIPIPDSYIEHPTLEQWTGADFMVSPLSIPAHSKTLLAKHLKAGAFLVQRKKGNDFVGSISDTGNLWDMLDRMKQFCREFYPDAAAAQRVILSIGAYLGHGEEKLTVNGKPPKVNISYWQLQGAIERIAERGCTYANISPGPDMFYKWIITKERHAVENLKSPTKHVVPKPGAVYEPGDKSLQELVVVRDARRTLITFPGMGEAKVNAVWDYSNKNLAKALTFITDPLLLKEEGRPGGVGKGLIADWRTWLGLEPGQLLFLGSDSYDETRAAKWNNLLDAPLKTTKSTPAKKN